MSAACSLDDVKCLLFHKDISELTARAGDCLLFAKVLAFDW